MMAEGPVAKRAGGVLIVDADPEVYRPLARQFRERGWEPYVATSARDALQATRMRRFALVVADPRPGGFGDELLRALDRERSALKTVGRVEPPSGTRASATLAQVADAYIQQVLRECHHNVSKAARRLGLDRRTVQRKLAKIPPDELETATV